jgi:hypothetical protein
MLFAVSRWMRKKAAWKRFWSNLAVFFVLQVGDSTRSRATPSTAALAMHQDARTKQQRGRR